MEPKLTAYDDAIRHNNVRAHGRAIGALFPAVLIHAGVAFARAVTTARNGTVVCYGWQTIDDGRAIHQVGTAKISRARKYLDNRELMANLEDKIAFVNFGGGQPI